MYGNNNNSYNNNNNSNNIVLRVPKGEEHRTHWAKVESKIKCSNSAWPQIGEERNWETVINFTLENKIKLFLITLNKLKTFPCAYVYVCVCVFVLFLWTTVSLWTMQFLKLFYFSGRSFLSPSFFFFLFRPFVLNFFSFYSRIFFVSVVIVGFYRFMHFTAIR